MNTDLKLIQDYVCNQNIDSLNTLISRYEEYIYSICLKYSANIDDAKDNLQEVLIKVITKISSFSSESKLSTWIFSVARNHCYDQYSRNKKHLSYKEEMPLNIEEIYYHESSEKDNQYYDSLKSSFKKLSPDEQSLLILKYQKKTSIKDISKKLQLSESCVKMRIKRAKNKAYLQLISPLSH